MDLNNLTITDSDSILDALKKIDDNRLGFVIGLNSSGQVCATLTDGDIRRYIINAGDINVCVSKAWNTNFTCITEDEGSFDDFITLFKNQKIHFIPVIDKDKRLINVITKDVMHALLLQDMRPGFSYPYLDVDSSIIEHEIFNRPWGFYKTTILNDQFQSKIISVDPGGTLSLQLHKRREEHWIIVHGTGTATIGSSVIPVHDGTYLFIPKECKHRLTNTSPDENLILIEVQCGDYFGEDDIIRFEDKYGRI